MPKNSNFCSNGLLVELPVNPHIARVPQKIRGTWRAGVFPDSGKWIHVIPAQAGIQKGEMRQPCVYSPQARRLQVGAIHESPLLRTTRRHMTDHRFYRRSAFQPSPQRRLHASHSAPSDMDLGLSFIVVTAIAPGLRKCISF